MLMIKVLKIKQIVYTVEYILPSGKLLALYIVVKSLDIGQQIM